MQIRFGTLERNKEMLRQRLEGYSYKSISRSFNLTRQRVQQILSPPRQIKEFIFGKYNNCCSECGLFVGRSGHIHHIGNNGEDYQDIDNLKLLCISCHRKAHNNSERICPYCKRTFRGGGDYCNRKCNRDSHRTKLPCATCGKEFVILKSRLERKKKRNKTGKVVCSGKCRRWAK